MSMRPRQEHSLRPVKSTRLPSQVMVVDARTGSQSTLAWHGIITRWEHGEWTRRSERDGKCITSMWDWLWSKCSKQRATWVIADDWAALAQLMDLAGDTEARGVETGKASITSRVWWVQLSHSGTRCELVDAHNMWQTLPAGTVQEPGAGIDCREAAYLTCRRLHRLITDTLSHASHAGLGVVQPTIGSWASNVWRHWHTGPRVRIHTDQTALQLERAACYGGEVIARREGKWHARYHGLDVNSLFPHAMGQWLQPYRLVHVQPSSTVAEIIALPRDHCAIARVQLDTPTTTYPVRSDGRLLCATGRFTTVLPWPELVTACTAGHVVSIGECAIYRAADLFSSWAQRIWAERHKHRSADAKPFGTLCKALSVALYGKIMARAVEWRAADKPCVQPWSWWIAIEDDKTEHYRAIGERVEQRVYIDGIEPHDSFPAIGACTTSAARLAMHAIRGELPHHSWVYQYIDSLVVDDDGLAALRQRGLIAPDVLGMLRHEWSCGSLEIRGPGWMIHDERRRISGIGNEARLVGTDTYEITLSQPPLPRAGAAGDSTSHASTRIVHFERPERTGTMDSEGWVAPPHLEQW